MECFPDENHGISYRMALQLFFFEEEENTSKPCRTATVGGLRCTVKVGLFCLAAGFIYLWKGKRMCFNDDKQ